MSEEPKDKTDSISEEWLKINEAMLKSFKFKQTPDNEDYVKMLLSAPPEDLLVAIETARYFANHYKRKLKRMDSGELTETFDFYRKKNYPIPETPITDDEDRVKRINLLIDTMKKDPYEIKLPESISSDSEFFSDPGDIPYLGEPTEQ